MLSGNNTNQSVSDIFMDGLDTVTVGYIYSVTCVFVIISNSIVVFVMSREQRVPSLWNIAFMALCDGAFGLYCLIFNVPSAFLNRFAYPMTMATFTVCINILLYGQNILNILLAIVDRFISVCYPLRYHQLMSLKRFGGALMVTIVINIVRCIAMLAPGGDVEFSNPIAFLHVSYNNPVSTFAAIGMPFLTFVVICSLLGYLIVDISRSRRQVHSETSPLNGRQLTVTVVLSATLFCLAYIPTCSTILWIFVHGREHFPLLLAQVAVIALLSNSLWNVAIYAVTYRPFRDAVMRMFCASWYRRQRQNEVIATFRKADRGGTA